MIGRTLSHYRIEAALGAGGMGVVYRARDLNLEREVALKVLPEGALADEAARKRFRREALALSKLNHPHIATIFDFGTQEGIDFLVMELVDGDSLAARLSHGPLAEAEVCALGGQIAEALEAAHEAGIIHRDLKPANVVVTAKGWAKVLDFGLARLVQPREGIHLTRSLTGDDVTVGTLPYMAPEHLLGKAVDARTDLYALGVVLYELATGKSPYREKLATALIYEIVHRPVISPRDAGAGISPRLEAIILNCLAKEPEARYANAHELAADLCEPERTVVAPRLHASRVRRRWAIGIVTLLVGALIGLGLALDLGGVRGRLLGGSGAGHIRSLAVLPLLNLSGDAAQDYFADGMTEELITSLAGLEGVRVISRTSVMKYKGTHKGLPQIARELGVDGVTEGSAMKAGGRVRITAQLIEAAHDRHLWARSYERDLRDVLGLQADVAQAIVGAIQIKLTPAEHLRLASAAQVDPAAHEAYLRGRSYLDKLNEKSFETALREFDEAIRLDPGSARAWVGVSETYYYASNIYLAPRVAMVRARSAAEKALAIAPDLGEAHAALGIVLAQYDWSWDAAEHEFRLALASDPNDATAHFFFALELTERGRWKEAERELAQAQLLDPLSEQFQTMWTAQPAFFQGRYDELIRRLIPMARINPDYPPTHALLGLCYLQKSEYVDAIRELCAALANADDPDFALSRLTCAFAAAGQRQEALSTLAQLQRLPPKTHVGAYNVAVAYAGLGDRDRAFPLLDQAIENRDEDVLSLRAPFKTRDAVNSLG